MKTIIWFILFASFFLAAFFLFATVANGKEFTDDELLFQMEEIIINLDKDLISSQAETKTIKTDLSQAQSNSDKLQKENDIVTAWGNKKSEEAKWEHGKRMEAIKKLWWCRLKSWFLIAAGLIVAFGGLLIKFTTWGAQTLGPIAKKMIGPLP